jgi:hypothetical protein
MRGADLFSFSAFGSQLFDEFIRFFFSGVSCDAVSLLHSTNELITPTGNDIQIIVG